MTLGLHLKKGDDVEGKCNSPKVTLEVLGCNTTMVCGRYVRSCPTSSNSFLPKDTTDNRSPHCPQLRDMTLVSWPQLIDPGAVACPELASQVFSATNFKCRIGRIRDQQLSRLDHIMCSAKQQTQGPRTGQSREFLGLPWGP